MPLWERRGTMQRAKRYVAFVCTGNTCRSPMGEAIFNKLATEKKADVIAESFGIATVTGAAVSDNSVAVLKEIGIDISGKTSTAVSDVSLEKFEKFYCMSQSHAKILSEYFNISPDKIAVLNVSDPYGGSVDVYRRCRDEIYNSIKELFAD